MNVITSKYHFTTISLSKPEKALAVPSSPIARKQSDLNVLPVTPSPTKDCGSKQPSVDDQPSFNAWKTSRKTPPTKMNDDPFIDARKPSSKSVPIEDKTTHSHTLIPVTTKMFKSALSKCNQFVLKDGRQLHLVKVVGAIVFYHEYWNNFTMEIEDGTGRIQVVLPRPHCKECNFALELHRKCTINSYVRVIGMVIDDFNIRTIIASDVWPVSSGNEITYHLLEVAYSTTKVTEKQMDEKMNEELRAVDLDKMIHEYQSAIIMKQKVIHAIDFDDVDDDDLNAIDLDLFITGHMGDVANNNCRTNNHITNHICFT